MPTNNFSTVVAAHTHRRPAVTLIPFHRHSGCERSLWSSFWGERAGREVESQNILVMEQTLGRVITQRPTQRIKCHLYVWESVRFVHLPPVFFSLLSSCLKRRPRPPNGIWPHFYFATYRVPFDFLLMPQRFEGQFMQRWLIVWVRRHWHATARHGTSLSLSIINGDFVKC